LHAALSGSNVVFEVSGQFGGKIHGVYESSEDSIISLILSQAHGVTMPGSPFGAEGNDVEAARRNPTRKVMAHEGG
jgi:hypothetical protein